MKRMVALIGLLLLSLTLISCGGGSSGDSGVHYRVEFGIAEGTSITPTGSTLTVKAFVSVRDTLASETKIEESDEGFFDEPRYVPAHGVDVKFAIYQNESGGKFETISSKTDANGEAYALYRVGNTPGEDIIQAKAKGASAMIRIKVFDGGIVSTILLSADPDNVDFGGLSTIMVQGLAFGDFPATGSQVDFSFLTNNSGAVFIDNGREVQELTRFLDINGKANVTYKGGNWLGVDTILAQFPLSGLSETISLIVGPVDTEPPVITSTTLPSGTQNTSYGFQLRASNGIQPYTWQIISGSLPSGLSLDSTTGLISGIPRNVGWFSFIAEVEDAIGLTGEAPLSLEIKAEEVEPSPEPEPLVITSTTLPSGIENTLYGFQLRASGGTKPFTWTITSGELPDELELNSATGLISGLPIETGFFDFIVEVLDDQGLSDFAILVLEIEPEP